jgi:hypothetical protein
MYLGSDILRSILASALGLFRTALWAFEIERELLYLHYKGAKYCSTRLHDVSKAEQNAPN